MDFLIIQLVALLSLTAIAILLISMEYREYKLRKKVDLLKHIIDNGYEHNNVDINSL